MSTRAHVKKPEQFRSHRWFGEDSLRGWNHHSRILQMGYARDDYQGKPIIGIVNTWSDIGHCHAHFRLRVEEVKRGVWQAGGFPIELPALSLAEPIVKPTTMLYRNMLAMETEELLRSHPVDGAVLMGGCDKTTPGLVMGATSMNLPSIFVPAGPMLRGNWEGKTLGSGSDAWKYWDELRAGTIDEDDWQGLVNGIARSYGHCMTMGTAATMTGLAETLGLTLPGAAAIPAADANHPRMATASGKRIVDMVFEDLRPSELLREGSFHNALVALMGLGGSTNAIIHLVAMARRAGVALDLQSFDVIARQVPVIANLRPSGEFLMEDFYYAGGMPAVLSTLREFLRTEAQTVVGVSLGDTIDKAKVHNSDVIRPLNNPIYSGGGLAVLFGSLAPQGCVIKASAAAPHLRQHEGPALVFENYEELKDNIDRDDLEVSADSILVLKHAGPQGGPGMPEWGALPIPRKLLQQGVRDMVRISDSRMSGTSYGACILHVSPEAQVGGPLALVRTGDRIRLDVEERRLDLLVEDAELEARKKQWTPPPSRYQRGYVKMFLQHIQQAHDGCDFDFLARGEETPEPDIF